jgi:hypothetical protein
MGGGIILSSTLLYYSSHILHTYHNVDRYSIASPSGSYFGRRSSPPVSYPQPTHNSFQSTLRQRLGPPSVWPLLMSRMQLKKLPITQTSLNPDGNDFRPSPEMEAEFLKHKHLGFQTPEWLESIGQKPLMGFGGEGRKMPSLSEVDEEAREKFWAMMMGDNHNQKRMVKGGHGVPLSGTSLVKNA